MKRRSFLGKSVAAGVWLGANLSWACSKPENPLKILVLGGTNFVGPAIVSAALKNNHQVALFNRGITNPQLFPNLRLIKGDRTTGLDAFNPMQEEEWDVVIDVWPEKSNLVDTATRFFQDKAKHFVFISSIAVYDNFQEVGLNEQSDVVSLEGNKEDWGYSEEKWAAEKMVRERFPNNHTILRPGPIKGWRDPAYDLLYWCIKLSQDDAIIAPGSRMDPLQFIDVKDVGRFAIMASEKNLKGTYNCTGPRKEPLLWKEFLALSKEHFQSQTQLVWANEEFLQQNEVYSFSDLPLWAPLSEDRGFMQISDEKLTQTGFEYTPISSTLDDCMKWYEDHMSSDIIFGTEDVGLGLDRERELQLIKLITE